jgi:hypothetical protein
VEACTRGGTIFHIPYAGENNLIPCPDIPAGEEGKGGRYMGGFFGCQEDNSLLFFFILLVLIFCNCPMFCGCGSELLFFFLILVCLFCWCD